MLKPQCQSRRLQGGCTADNSFLHAQIQGLYLKISQAHKQIRVGFQQAAGRCIEERAVAALIEKGCHGTVQLQRILVHGFIQLHQHQKEVGPYLPILPQKLAYIADQGFFLLDGGLDFQAQILVKAV